MSDYNEGDLIEAVKDKARVTDVATRSNLGGGLYLPIMRGAIYLDTLERGGWTLTVLEKAAPPLPTEPGWYLDKYDDIWGVSAEGRFGYRGRTWAQPGEDVTAYAPFTRLEPVPVTVQKVIDYLTAEGCTRRPLDGVRKHFGVTS
jgi:hypothetical protein